ncbi:MAG TPA: SWIM zinc finger family protein [Holophagaceae bacterium]
MITTADRFGATWWGRLWIRGLEQLGDDYENRLPRGKKYAEDGHVSHFVVKPGEIEARVHGRKTYNVTLGLPALTSTQWEKALARITQESRFVASLLTGEMPQGLDETFREAGASLYPRVPKELQTHCDCPDWANPCKHVAAVCYVMAEALDRDPWLLFDLRGKSREDVMQALQAALEAAAVAAPKKRGRPPKKKLTVADQIRRAQEQPEPWQAMPEPAFDALPAPLPDVVIPRAIPPDPSVFTQLGPLPHARIEASLCLAALMHRTAQWVHQQIEDGPGRMEDEEAESQASPFDAPLPPLQRPNRPWRHRKKRWGGKGGQ